MFRLRRKKLAILTGFNQWLDTQDKLFQQFDNMAYMLEEYLENHVLDTYEKSEKVASRLLDVYKSCDLISYQEDGTAAAYAILHFLDRYHRFQLIYTRLLSEGILPIKNRVIDVLDIGTGPSPALFALLDIYYLLNEYAKITTDLDAWKNQIVKTNYVEQSCSFRDWLHHFLEYIPSQHYTIPFNNGSFWDFKDVQFDKKVQISDYDSDGDLFYRDIMSKYRIDMAIFSYFLTTEDFITSHSEVLRRIVQYTRNKGILLVVGARKNNSCKYTGAYKSIKKTFVGKYNNWKFISSCKSISFSNNQMSYRYTDKFGNRLKQFYTKILDLFAKRGATHLIPPEVYNDLCAAIKDAYDYEVKWEIRTFIKRSKPHSRFRRKINPTNYYNQY